MGFWQWVRGEKRKTQNLSLSTLSNLTITLEYKAIKHIVLRIKEPSCLHISAPFGVSIEEIVEVVRKREKWIASKHNSLLKVSEENYKSGGVIYHLGEKKQIDFYPSSRCSVKMQEGVLRVGARSEEQIKQSVLKWQKAEAYGVYTEVLGMWEKRLGVQISHLSIKKMTSRWGSCNPTKGYINLNLALIKMPKELIEYVALHEMIHFFHFNHSKSFYAMMSRYLPEWKQREILLREWRRKISS